MTGKAGLKAGLISVVIMLVWTLLGQVIPQEGVLRWVAIVVGLLIYAGIGVLAAFFLTQPRAAGKGAGAGAIAGAIAGAVGAAAGIAIMAIRLQNEGTIPGVEPEQMQQLAEIGIPPLVAVSLGMPCVPALGAGVAAVGGAIFAAVKPD